MFDLKPVPIDLKISGDSMLVVSGSVNRITLNQISNADELGYVVHVLTPEQKIDSKYFGSKDYEDFCIEIVTEIRERRKVLITAIGCIADIASTNVYAEQCNLTDFDSRNVISKNIGLIVAGIIEKCDIDNLVVFGGDTLHGILTEIGYTGVVPITSIASSVVVAKIRPESKVGTLITKSGGLGAADVLSEIDEFIDGGKESEHACNSD
jgi:uncharacterized protein YgbK (DUF1537 family)